MPLKDVICGLHIKLNILHPQAVFSIILCIETFHKFLQRSRIMTSSVLSCRECTASVKICIIGRCKRVVREWSCSTGGWKTWIYPRHFHEYDPFFGWASGRVSHWYFWNIRSTIKPHLDRMTPPTILVKVLSFNLHFWEDNY